MTPALVYYMSHLKQPLPSKRSESAVIEHSKDERKYKYNIILTELHQIVFFYAHHRLNALLQRPDLLLLLHFIGMLV